MDEGKKREIKNLLARITKLIEEVLDEKEPVEEISTGVGLGGAPGPLGGLGMPRKRSTRRRIVRPDPPKRKR